MNQVARSGAGAGATSRPGAVCGATQVRTSVPAKSKPAAAFAAARCASISSAGCAAAGARPKAVKTASVAKMRDVMDHSVSWWAKAAYQRSDHDESQGGRGVLHLILRSRAQRGVSKD